MAAEGRSNQRLDGSGATAISATNVAIGVGWGGTATFTVAAGSNDVRGRIVVTASATTPAQATASIAITFANPWAVAPKCIQKDMTNTNSLTAAQPITVVSITTTVATLLSSIIPVAAAVYTLDYCFAA